MVNRNHEIQHTGIEQMVCICFYIYYKPQFFNMVDRKGLRGTGIISSDDFLSSEESSSESLKEMAFCFLQFWFSNVS